MNVATYVLVMQVQHVKQCFVGRLPSSLMFALGGLVVLYHCMFLQYSNVHSHTDSKFGSSCSTAEKLESMMAIFRYFKSAESVLLPSTQALPASLEEVGHYLTLLLIMTF